MKLHDEPSAKATMAQTHLLVPYGDHCERLIMNAESDSVVVMMVVV
jgi:hypothetical protein